MPAEIIDLTGSPPPPPSRSSPRILNFAAANSAAEHVQFGNLAMPLWPSNNPNPNNLPYTNQQHPTIWRTTSGNAYESTQVHIHQSIETQTQKILTVPAVWPASAGHTYDPSQTAISFQPHMHGDQVTAVLEPVAEANAYLFPHGTRLRETWTPREHELFLMGLIKYGRGRWTKIARHFLSNKTPQQVQSYANSYFRNLPSTHLYSFRRRNSAYSTASFLAAGNNLIRGASSVSSYNMPNLVTANSNNNNNNNDDDNNGPIKKTLMLFPEKLDEPSNFFQVQPLIGEASTTTITNNTNNNNNYAYYGSFQMQTIGAGITSSMNASGNYGEVDLELRLGSSQ